jgi:transcriptional regulator with XRE-family HTH domain
VVSMSEPHPMLRWAANSGMSIEQLAEAAKCSPAHLRNIFAGRREASLGLAVRLSEISGGAVPIDAFLKPVLEDARA